MVQKGDEEKAGELRTTQWPPDERSAMRTGETWSKVGGDCMELVGEMCLEVVRELFRVPLLTVKAPFGPRCWGLCREDEQGEAFLEIEGSVAAKMCKLKTSGEGHSFVAISTNGGHIGREFLSAVPAMGARWEFITARKTGGVFLKRPQYTDILRQKKEFLRLAICRKCT